MAIGVVLKALGAVAKGARAAKGAQAAGKAAKATRAKRASDEAYNARRRLKRRAERYEKQAAGAEGAAARRFRTLAASLRETAARTYRDRTSGTYDLNALAQGRKGGAAVSDMGEEAQADILMRSHIGGRIWAATADVWRDLPYDEREGALLKEFGVETLADLFKVLERALGEDLYSDESRAKYDEVVTKILEMRRS